MKHIAFVWLFILIIVGGCAGPASLHRAVLSYDEVISKLETEMILINIARTYNNLPTHFTVTSNIAASFDYKVNVGIKATILERFFIGSNKSNTYNPEFGISMSEKPTINIVPISGEEFTKRILSPIEESNFMFLVYQGAPIDMLLRLVGRGIEVQNEKDGTFKEFILNWSTRPTEYEEFRRRALHLAWLNATRNLFVGVLSFEESSNTKLSSAPSPGEFRNALKEGYYWKLIDQQGTYELVRPITGRVAITNYDPRTLTNDERQALNALASAKPKNFVFVDIREGYPGGKYPLFGAIKLRSLNEIFEFVAAGIDNDSEYEVTPDPRTEVVTRNPQRTFAVNVKDHIPPRGTIKTKYRGRYYYVANTPWDREAFKLLYQLFQMTVTDVSGVGAPVLTISK